MSPATSAYNFFIGWLIIIGLFWGSTKFEGTKTLTYYILWLAIILTLVTHADELNTLIQGAVPTATDQNLQEGFGGPTDQFFVGNGIPIWALTHE